MTITLNGESTQTADNRTIFQLLEELGFDPSRVAVEHNLEVAPREQYQSIALSDGDQVEIVHFIGGGSF